jgi:predicted SprT family Zn-dependent metalloprotease
VPIGAGDVRDVLVRVALAHGELKDLLGRLNHRDVEWDRLAQASHALTRATHLLEGESLIG